MYSSAVAGDIMKKLLVAGTDTGVGKTVVTGCLANFLLKKGASVITQKWVETGSSEGSSQDIDSHLKMMGKDRKDFSRYRSLMAPYVFSFPASPHLASRLEAKSISCKKIKKAFLELSRSFDFVIAEAAGGVLVPLDSRHLLIDIAKDLSLPVLLVAENRLGSINHTLLSVEALRSRGMEILGIVFNNIKNCDKKILEDNVRIIRRLSGVSILGVLRKASSQKRLCAEFVPIAKNITSKMRIIRTK